MKTCSLSVLVITVTCVAQGPQDNAPSSITFTPSPTTVRWEGRNYASGDAVQVLLDCVKDSKTSAKRREDALNTLSHLGKALHGQRRLDELAPLYLRAKTRNEKGAILVCFANSMDPRGLPLFTDVIEREQDPVLQLCAAGGLADRNVRSGVEKLIALLSSDAQVGAGRSVADEAANLLRDCNARNHWNVPEQDFIDAITKDPTLSSADYVHQYQLGWLDWLERNKERFPNWKPGDPPPPDPQAKTAQP